MEGFAEPRDLGEFLVRVGQTEISLAIINNNLQALAPRHPEQSLLRLRDLGAQRVLQRLAAASGNNKRACASRRSRESTDPPPQVVRQGRERS